MLFFCYSTFHTLEDSPNFAISQSLVLLLSHCLTLVLSVELPLHMAPSHPPNPFSYEDMY